MTVKEFFTNVKTWIAIAACLVAAVVWVNKFQVLPAAVEANAKNIGELTSNVKEVVVAQKMAIKVNEEYKRGLEEYKKGQAEQHDLMIKIMEK